MGNKSSRGSRSRSRTRRSSPRSHSPAAHAAAGGGARAGKKQTHCPCDCLCCVSPADICICSAMDGASRTIDVRAVAGLLGEDAETLASMLLSARDARRLERKPSAELTQFKRHVDETATEDLASLMDRGLRQTTLGMVVSAELWRRGGWTCVNYGRMEGRPGKRARGK